MERKSVSFEQLITGLPARRVIVLGDAMLDRFIYGRVSRISPEAPTPVIVAEKSEESPGGAANVARIVGDLGASCRLISAVGEDEAAKALRARLAESGATATLVTDPRRATTLKQRFVSAAYNAHLLRADWETEAPIDSLTGDQILSFLQKAAREAQVLVLSDYKKGVLTPDVIARAISLARDRGLPVVVDPKGVRFERYAGCDVITPNLKELSDDLGETIPNEEGPIIEGARRLIERIGCRAVIVTRSEQGITVVNAAGEVTSLPPTARRVVDVSGAGDGVVAGMAVCLAGGATVEIAARVANAIAGVVVGKRGAASLTVDELADALLSRPLPRATGKLVKHRSHLLALVEGWRQEGFSVGFTNGCFDLIHPGHIEVLRQARAECDRLIVAINSDVSVRRLKGPRRPIQNEDARAAVLAAMSFVDVVVMFQEDTPLGLIEAVAPDVLVKGADYTPNEVVGGDFVERHGGRVHLARLVPENSTSDILRRILTSGISELSRALDLRANSKV